MKKLTNIALAGIAAAAVFIGGAYSGIHFWSEPPTAAVQNSDKQRAGAGRPAASGARRGRPPALVVTAPVTQALVNDRLMAVGSGTAQSSVSIVPLSGGVLSQVLVTPGQFVTANTLLATLDDEEQLIARERAASAVIEAKTDAERLEKLFRSRTTTQVELNRAKALLNDADFALRDATLKFDRRSIRAPIDGFVGFVAVDEGNFVNAQTEIMTIDDRSTIVVEFWVPERFANQIQVDQTLEAVALSRPSMPLQGTVVGIGSRIESDSRTLPVKASIDNTDDILRPGMSFELKLAFEGETHPAINPLAIQWDSKGAYVWQVVDDKVQRVDANIIQRNPESVLVNAALNVGDEVVIEGVLSVRNGASVRVQGQPANGPGRGKATPLLSDKKPVSRGKPDSAS